MPAADRARTCGSVRSAFQAARSPGDIATFAGLSGAAGRTPARSRRGRVLGQRDEAATVFQMRALVSTAPAGPRAHADTRPLWIAQTDARDRRSLGTAASGPSIRNSTAVSRSARSPICFSPVLRNHTGTALMAP